MTSRCFLYRGCGLYPEADRFFIFFAVIAVLHYLGEIFTVALLAVFSQAALAQSIVTLLLSVSSLLATGLLRFGQLPFSPLPVFPLLCSQTKSVLINPNVGAGEFLGGLS